MMSLRTWMVPESEDIHFFNEGESVSSFNDVHAIGHKLAMIVLRGRPILTLSTTAFNDTMLGSSSGLRADYPIDALRKQRVNLPDGLSLVSLQIPFREMP